MVGRRLAWETTIAFRLFVILAIVGLAVFSYIQYQSTVVLRESLTRGTVQLEGVAADLARARKESIRPSDLSALREELTSRVSTNVERLEALERASDATMRVIADAYPAVALLQGTYGMRQTESGKMLRHVLSAEGIPLIAPSGRPLLTISGDGPVAEIQFTGTAFLLKDTPLLISNRHVAMPWETGTDAKALAARGFEPVMQKFLAYFPGLPDGVPVAVVTASETADLVVLTMGQVAPKVTGLALAAQPPTIGEEILVIGYPTGLRSLLAQSGTAFIEQLQDLRRDRVLEGGRAAFARRHDRAAGQSWDRRPDQ